MSFLNVNLNLLAYADGPASNQPQVRLADLKWSMMGLQTDKVRQIPIALAPGESILIATTARTIVTTPMTSFAITSQSGGKMRIAGDFGQRLTRDAGDATTEWEATKTGEIVRLRHTGTGAAPDFGTIQPGDSVTLDAPFAQYNRGDFMVLGKGSDYIEFKNPLAADETVVGQVDAYSSGPVQKNDVLDISSQAFSFANRGSFPVTRVTNKFIEVVNPNAYPETVTGVTSGFSIYPYAYKWMFMAVDRKVTAALNGDTGSSVEIEPHVEGDYSRNPGIFLKRGKVFEVRVSNPGQLVASGILLLAE